MKIKDKKIIYIAIAVVFVILIAIIIVNKISNHTSNTGKDDKNKIVKIDVNREFKEERKFEELTITDIEYENKANGAVFKANFKNNTKKASEEKQVELSFYDKKGNVIDSVSTVIGSIESDSFLTVKIAVPTQEEDLYNFEIKKVVPENFPEQSEETENKVEEKTIER